MTLKFKLATLIILRLDIAEIKKSESTLIRLLSEVRCVGEQSSGERKLLSGELLWLLKNGGNA